MNQTIRAMIGVVLVFIIFFCAINICQNVGRSLKIDVTQKNLYTLSDGTKVILAKLNQPIKLKLYYAKTASMKGPDQIRFFSKYYEFIKSLLKEYESISAGMIQLEIIDPRPFSDNEAQALKHGLQRFPITAEENFFFGLVLQTQFGVEKTIPFFSPDRQNFIEYDISYLIDTAITRKKSKIGIISSLPITGDNVTGYMAQMMRMQGQKPKPAWTFVEQLRGQYEVKNIEPNVSTITDTDLLLVIHPKDLPEKVLFAIDQFVLNGGRTIFFVDPHCVVDKPDRQQMQMRMGSIPSQSSELNKLFNTWGLDMPNNKFAGDRTLALMAALGPNQRPSKIIGLLELTPTGNCFNKDNAVTANLNQVRVLFSGILELMKNSDEFKDITYIPLLSTSNRGNSWKVDNNFELMYPNPGQLMKKFTEGTKPINMGYIVSGKFKSAFPDGIEIEAESEPPDAEKDDKDDQVSETKEKLTGLKTSSEDSVIAVFADVDMISDMMAYQNSFFGRVVVGDNIALLLNAIETLSGSADLLSIRSRGNFKRPFIRVDEIEQEAEKKTADEEEKINAQIRSFQKELQDVINSAKRDEQEVIGSTILKKKQDLELKLHEAQRGLRNVKMKRRQEIEALGSKLKIFNMLLAPLVILMIAVFLGIRSSLKKRYYISHASDA